MTPQPATALFALVCAGGSAAAVLLAVSEARTTDPVVALVSGTSRSGRLTTAEVALRNTTARPQCVRVQVVARDRAGHDLGGSGATAVRLAAHAGAHLQARFSLTPQQYAEELSTVRPHLEGCV